MTTEIGVLYTGPMPGDPYDEYETFMGALPGEALDNVRELSRLLEPDLPGHAVTAVRSA